MRGINSEKKQLAIRNAIDISGCSVVCLQETKRASFDASFVKQFCPKKFDMFEFVPSVGNSGGLITIWMSSVFTATHIFSETFALGVRLTSTQSNDSWRLVNIYGHALIQIGRFSLPGCLILTFLMVKIGSSSVTLTSFERRTTVTGEGGH